jgi:hypothetical protein
MLNIPPSSPHLSKERSWLILFMTSLALSLAFSACKSGPKTQRGGSCKKDSDCISEWICEDNFCMQGERNAAEIAALKEAKRKAKEDKRKAKEAKKRQTKSGEGRLHARICPFFKNTDDSVATLIAVNNKTKKRHLKSLHLEVNKDSMKDLFTFYSLPLGEYTITAKYGVQVNGIFDTHELKCDPKQSHRPCQDGVKRIAKVELPKGSLEDDLKQKYPCDWIAE